MENLTHVKQAISAMSNPSETAKANEWLVEFEKSPAAWTAGDALLRENKGSPCRFFGAKFLYAKLTEALIAHLLRLAGEQPIEWQLIRYLCMSIAGLAIQCKQSGCVDQILTWLNSVVTTSPGVLLVLLTLLPEEVYNRSIDTTSEVRELFQDQLRGSSEQVLGFLLSLTSHAAPSRLLDTQTAKCLEIWIDIVLIPVEMLERHGVLGLIQQSLIAAEDTTLDAMVDLVLQLIHSHPNTLPVLLPSILALIPRWSRPAEAYSMCKLFNEVSLLSLDAFTNTLGPAAGHAQSALLDVLLACCGYADESVSRLPLVFFYELSLRFTGTEQELAAYRTAYASTYTSLLQACLHNTTMPTSCLRGGKLGEVLERRSDWSDSILDCAYVLGADNAMAMLCHSLEESIKELHSTNGSGNGGGAAGGGANGAAAKQQDAIWCRLEALLWTITVLLPKLTTVGGAYMPQLITFLMTLPRDLVNLHHTVIDLLGRLAPYMSQAEGLLIYEYLLTVCTSQINTSASVGTKSLASMLRVVTPMVSLLANGHARMEQVSMLNNGSLPMECILNWLEGLACAASRLPSGESQQLMNSLLTAYASRLPAVSAIDCLSVLIKYCSIPEPGSYLSLVMEILQHIHSMRIPPTEHISERICRCYRFLIKHYKKPMMGYLPSLQQLIIEQFSLAPMSSYLYATSTLITTYPELSDMSGLVYGMSQTFFSHFNSLQAFATKPDLVEEYYYLMAKLLLSRPQVLLESQELSAMVLSAALEGLALDHREAQKGILLFLEHYLACASSAPPPSGGPQQTATSSSSSMILRDESAGRIVMGLMKLLNGTMPLYAIDESNGCIADVLWGLKRKVPVELKCWLQSALSTFPPPIQQIAEAQGLVDSMLSAKTMRDFSTALARFEASARRAMK